MDFDELFDSDLPWELLEKELEKKRLRDLEIERQKEQSELEQFLKLKEKYGILGRS